MYHGVLCHSDGLLGYAHVANKMPVFALLECRTFHEIMVMKFLATQVFVCVYFGISVRSR